MPVQNAAREFFIHLAKQVLPQQVETAQPNSTDPHYRPDAKTLFRQFVEQLKLQTLLVGKRADTTLPASPALTVARALRESTPLSAHPSIAQIGFWHPDDAVRNRAFELLLTQGLDKDVLLDDPLADFVNAASQRAIKNAVARPKLAANPSPLQRIQPQNIEDLYQAIFNGGNDIEKETAAEALIGLELRSQQNLSTLSRRLVSRYVLQDLSELFLEVSLTRALKQSKISTSQDLSDLFPNTQPNKIFLAAFHLMGIPYKEDRRDFSNISILEAGMKHLLHVGHGLDVIRSQSTGKGLQFDAFKPPQIERDPADDREPQSNRIVEWDARHPNRLVIIPKSTEATLVTHENITLEYLVRAAAGDFNGIMNGTVVAFPGMPASIPAMSRLAMRL